MVFPLSILEQSLSELGRKKTGNGLLEAMANTASFKYNMATVFLLSSLSLLLLSSYRSLLKFVLAPRPFRFKQMHI